MACKPKQSTYSEVLRDPRWQKKRLEILSRDNFTCRSCDSTTETLNVHHCFYERHQKPWDYPDGSLVTLCETCHEIEADAIETKINFTNALASKGARAEHFACLAKALNGNELISEIEYFIAIIEWALTSNSAHEMILYAKEHVQKEFEASHG